MNNILLVSLQKRGGGAIDSLELSNGLCANAFRHDIIISSGNELRGQFSDNEYRRVLRVPTYGGTMMSFLLATVTLFRPAILVRAIVKMRPSVIHVTHFHPWVVIVFLMKFIFGYTIVYAVHEDPYARKDSGNPAIMGPLEQFFIKRADVVATYSNYMKECLAKNIPGQTIRTVMLPAYDSFCPGFKARTQTHDSNLRLLFWGTIKPYKGLDVLVDAMKICRKKRVDVDLTIAGSGGGDIDSDMISSLGIVWLNRFISNEETCELLGKADMMVLPYKEATQAGPGALALGCRMPVLATSAGALSEQVEEGVNGMLARPDDAEDLARIIEYLAEHKELIIKFRDGAERMHGEKFSPAAVAKKMIAEIYVPLRRAD